MYVKLVCCNLGSVLIVFGVMIVDGIMWLVRLVVSVLSGSLLGFVFVLLSCFVSF